MARLGVVLLAAALFVLGTTVAVLVVEPAGAQETTTGLTTTDGGAAATATLTTGENGSQWLFVGLILGLAGFFAVPYVIDVIRTHRRWDKLLEAATARPEGLTADEFREFGTRSPVGIDGLARSLMAFGVIGILGAALFYVLVQTPTANSSTIISNLLSTLGTLATAVIAFYFGTRAGQTAEGGAGAGASGATTAPPVPTNTAKPMIDGTPTLGSTLTATPGVWSGLPSIFDYQWQREGDADEWHTVASGQSYAITSEDPSHRIRVTVSATSSGGTSEPAASEPVTVSY